MRAVPQDPIVVAVGVLILWWDGTGTDGITQHLPIAHPNPYHYSSIGN